MVEASSDCFERGYRLSVSCLCGQQSDNFYVMVLDGKSCVFIHFGRSAIGPQKASPAP